MKTCDKKFVIEQLSKKKEELVNISNQLGEIEYYCSEDIEFGEIYADILNAVESISNMQKVVEAHEVTD